MTLNRPFWDGSRMRRRHRGEKRGYNLPLIATELVGAGIVLGLVAGVLVSIRRVLGLNKKKIGHA